MSMSFAPPQPPVFQSMQPPHSATHGSIGAVIGVLAVVLFLCAVAVFIGRLCSGIGIMGQTHYDMESWVESKCSSCVDGRVFHPPPPPPPPPPSTNEAVIESREETPAENVASS